MCKFYGWTLKDIRELNIFDYNVAIKLMNDHAREQKKSRRKSKMSRKRH